MYEVWLKNLGKAVMESSLSAETCREKHGVRQETEQTVQSVFFSSLPHLRELAVSKPLQPPHAVAGLPLARRPPRHHDARPPGEAFDFPPDQLADSKTLVVLEAESKSLVSLSYCQT